MTPILWSIIFLLIVFTISYSVYFMFQIANKEKEEETKEVDVEAVR